MNIKVSYDQMLNASSLMVKHAESYEACFQKMYADIRNINAVWNGEDHNAYLNSIEEFEPNFVKMKELLVRISEFVKNACNEYSAAQDAIKQHARSLGIN